MEFNTRLLHGGFGADKATGATLAPIYQVSAFAQESAEKLEAVFNNRAPGFAYSRISNPTVASFETNERPRKGDRCSSLFLRNGGGHDVAA